jgi:hypothetical protein
MPQRFEAGRVSAGAAAPPGIRNITIAAESLAGLVLEPGADVAIRLLGGDGGTDERHYSVWKSAAEGTVDLCVVLHGLGPGSRWAGRCAEGDPTRSRVPTLSQSHSTARGKRIYSSATRPRSRRLTP